MKTLTSEQIDNFVQLLALTEDREMHCGDFLQYVGEYARTKVEGLPLDETLRLVEQHASVCPECRAEYEALACIIRAGV